MDVVLSMPLILCNPFTQSIEYQKIKLFLNKSSNYYSKFVTRNSIGVNQSCV